MSISSLSAEGDAATHIIDVVHRLAARRFRMRHVEALVAQPVYVERRAELAALLLEHALPPLLL